MERTTRASRMAVQVALSFFEFRTNEQGAWYEAPLEVKTALAWGRRKAELLRWVRRQMEKRLTDRERQCLAMYYFQNLNYLEIGRATRIHTSTVCRAIQRAVLKLRAAALEDPSWRKGALPTRNRR